MISSLIMTVFGGFSWIFMWLSRESNRLKVCLQTSQVLQFEWMLLFRCFCRWLCCLNNFSHDAKGQLNGFESLWSFLCFASDDELENIFSQDVHLKHFSLVCVVTCSFIFESRENILSQNSHRNFFWLTSSWFALCWFRLPAVENAEPQTLQTKFLILECVSRWFLRLVWWMKSFGHSLQANFLMLRWIRWNDNVELTAFVDFMRTYHVLPKIWRFFKWLGAVSIRATVRFIIFWAWDFPAIVSSEFFLIEEQLSTKATF